MTIKAIFCRGSILWDILGVLVGVLWLWLPWPSSAFGSEWEHRGEALVILGVVGEFPEILFKRCPRLSNKARRRWADRLGTVAWVLLVLGLWKEISESVVATHKLTSVTQDSARTSRELVTVTKVASDANFRLAAATNQAATAMLEAGLAGQQAGKANERAAEAYERANQLALRAKELESTNLVLQARVIELEEWRRPRANAVKEFNLAPSASQWHKSCLL